MKYLVTGMKFKSKIIERYINQLENLEISKVVEKSSLIENMFCKMVQIWHTGNYVQVDFPIHMHPLGMQCY